MEHVTIISQEAITRGLIWPPVVIGVIAMIFAVSGMIIVWKNVDLAGKLLGAAGIIGIPAMFLSMLICSIFFPVETGRYKYEGTLDPDMTIVEFEEFQQHYSNVRFEDGVWKWEDKE